MKCLLCPSTVDESLAVPKIEGPGGVMVYDVGARLRLIRELERWTHVTLTAQLPGDCRTLASGHVCSKHDLRRLTVVEQALAEETSALPTPRGKTP